MKSTRNNASRLHQWRTLGSVLLALSLLFTGVSASASSIGLVTSSSGSLAISTDLNVVGGDAAGGAYATMIAPDFTLCDERIAMVARINAAGDLQVCKVTGSVWTWQTHQLVGSNIANNAVNTDHIAANAVTSAKIASGAVTTAKLANSAVTNEKLANSAVSTAKLQNSSVTTSKLSSDAKDYMTPRPAPPCPKCPTCPKPKD